MTDRAGHLGSRDTCYRVIPRNRLIIRPCDKFLAGIDPANLIDVLASEMNAGGEQVNSALDRPARANQYTYEHKRGEAAWG